ncbi:hypothetical protein BJ508DRAFT_367778 [Ascobolus immersus RN42]|uniref:F-box domain-containing protein n=1 Tax=Ascobolus immersus RN42 TaxID=1160509 RepID=A0A3N4H9X4_ASCIM|nr:hypothetical protein BJ508DRAFT_367778 [Ascobolus immersus RN42]
MGVGGDGGTGRRPPLIEVGEHQNNITTFPPLTKVFRPFFEPFQSLPAHLPSGMPKRARSTSPEPIRLQQRPKRVRPLSTGPPLSDELYLRIFTYLEITDLVACQLVCHRFYRIAGDSHVWKGAFYNSFIQPRLRQRPPTLTPSKPPDNEEKVRSQRLKRWLDDEAVSHTGADWKGLYKLRQNWLSGSCEVSEVEVAREGGELLVGLKDDSEPGFNLSTPLPFRNPTTLAIDTTSTTVIRFAIGFSTGSIALFTLDPTSHPPFTRTSTLPPSAPISALAYTHPYLASLTTTQEFTLYTTTTPTPTLISTLQSQTIEPPFTLGIREAAGGIYISIVYTFPLVLGGWSVGVQELRLSSSSSSSEIHSRIATSVPTSLAATSAASGFTSLKTPTSSLFALPEVLTKPTSISYSHPYLLLSHADNTLTVFLVSSIPSSLRISPGARLWGHTSAVSGAQVAGRGKAVSVSRRGGEVRVWELEKARGMRSVALVGERGGDDERKERENCWVGFDREQIVVLAREGNGAPGGGEGEVRGGRRVLVVYDFV